MRTGDTRVTFNVGSTMTLSPTENFEPTGTFFKTPQNSCPNVNGGVFMGVPERLLALVPSRMKLMVNEILDT
jgi:hypothetical protein